ncbi:MAG: hypothetical protein R6U19_00375, partial [Bacteroidales bacterium]
GSTNEDNPNYGGVVLEGYFYDSDNSNYLYYLVPEYIRENPNNEQHRVFIDMVGHYYDIIWLYIKHITEFLNNTNNPNEGVSQDIISYILESFGIKLPQSSLDNPIISEWVVSDNKASLIKQVQKEIYQRLYHNLPHLIRNKGTLESLRQIINIWGLSDIILEPVEFNDNKIFASFPARTPNP